MKNRLFAAFLTFAAIPCFADIIIDQQPSKEDLIINLKTELIYIQEGIKEHKRFQTEQWKKNDIGNDTNAYVFLVTLYEEIFSIPEAKAIYEAMLHHPSITEGCQE